jgi:hypothetical protein
MDAQLSARSIVADPAVHQATAAPTRCWRLGITVFLQYFLLALDIRFVATRNFIGIIVVNALIATMGWYVVRGIVQAHAVRERISYVIGGTSGAVLAVWLT